MKLIVKILPLSLAFLVFSCNPAPPQVEDTQDDIVITPAVLLEDSEDTYSLKSKRSYEDVITKLYKEALEKNAALAKLDNAIQEIPQMKYDSLMKYEKYSNTNSNYYNVAQQYANRISDSTTKRAAVELFSNLEEQYKHSVSEYDTLISRIDMHEQELHDQLILMKLFVTKPMINSYQNNELPNISELNNLLNKYQRLIKESEGFIK